MKWLSVRAVSRRRTKVEVPKQQIARTISQMSLIRKAADAAAIAAFGLGLCLASVDAKADGTNVRTSAPPEINWSGWYVGAHAGWGQWNVDRGYPVDEHYVQAGNFLSQSTNGWFTGGQVGFNHQFSRIVVGGEFSLSNANIDTSATVQGYPADPPVRLTTKLSNLVTATVRVGATHGPFLFYVKGGVAGGEITAKSWDPQPHWSEVTHWTGGWVIGTGFELFLHRNITWGIEYDFVGLEAKTFNGPVNYSSSVPALPAFQNTAIESDIRLVMTRLNFKFGP
jgi:outer membrane immunogenic protein